jgi:hypothetical protein
MKKIITKFFTIFMIVLLSNNLNAQNITTDAASASATIITPITITNTTALNFGDIVNGIGIVTLSTVGERATDYQAFSGTQTGIVTAASFDITGQGAYTYAIILPTSDVTLTEPGGGTMTVNSFVSDPSGVGTLTASAGSVLVGASLNIDQGLEIGVYDGSFDVTVAYN